MAPKKLTPEQLSELWIKANKNALTAKSITEDENPMAKTPFFYVAVEKLDIAVNRLRAHFAALALEAGRK